ncbi:hypothetical protein ACCAA_100001 [Candidatus Accumulibacter aalborgensis]|uniref:Hemolysin-type calcium-binding region n=1 Tax=Candidatus Accumulibacter aalborgensis TaxID=1860102 RepID=A0A1A8XH47_9PROT|nr:hypothetical protein [Candidatus Accumulibacter aalborgensis]SBT03263.1 hypothetical protein ACCAA_100001 [Candidatus Accumulibacter aalborgensis]
MATFLFSGLSNGGTIAFNPVNDILSFDSSTIAAASVAVSSPNTSSALFSAAGKVVRVDGLSLAQVSVTNVTFADGSRILVGDGSVSTLSDELGNTLSGTKFGDLILGLGGNDSIMGGMGNDVLIGGGGNDTLDGGPWSVIGTTDANGGQPYFLTGISSPELSQDGHYLVWMGLGSSQIVEFRKDLVTGQVDLIQATANLQTVSVSADGRFVAMQSFAQLVPGGSGTSTDVYVKDLQTGGIVRASTTAAGVAGRFTVFGSEIADDGRHIGFLTGSPIPGVGDSFGPGLDNQLVVKNLDTGAVSAVTVGTGLHGGTAFGDYQMSANARFVAFSSNGTLVASDTDASFDVYVKDMETNTLTLASVAPDGSNLNGAFNVDMSSDGQFVTFLSGTDVQKPLSLYWRNMETAEVRLVSLSATNSPFGGLQQSSGPAISDDGRFIVFQGLRAASASSFVDDGIRVWDRDTGQIALVSKAIDGSLATGVEPAISGDGRLITFRSKASNIVSGDANGSEDIFVLGNPLYSGPQPAGAGGIDVAVFSGNLTNYALTKTGSSYTVRDLTGTDGIDTISNVERLKFANVSLALDVDGNAGKVAKILGAVFGRESVSNKEYVGIGLNLIDGGMTYEALAGLAIGVTGKKAPVDVVDLLWTNVVGSHPSPGQAQPFVDMLNNGMTTAALVVLASDTALNQINVNLVGLQQTGLEYI